MLPPELTNKIDDLMKGDLLYWRGLCFGWLLLATKIVVVGLIIEGSDLIYEIFLIVRRRVREHRWGFALLKADIPEWMKIVAFVGWLLIVIGVAGEWITDGIVSDADRNVEAFNAIMLTDARRETALAFERAAHAEATAKGFDARIADSDAKAKSADATAKQFEAQIALAQRDAAESRKEAESERLARVTLQKELEPRRLTGEQKKKLTTLLRGKPIAGIGILYNPIFSECADFANDIGDAMNRAGWKTVFIPASTSEHGVEIGTSKESDMTLLTPIMQELKQALLAVGVSSRISAFDRKNRGIATELEKNVLYLAIDNKPEIAHAP